MTLDDKAYQEVLLALLIWREARGESEEAQIAVACTVRERVKRPSWWGHNWIEVITKKWQYSSIAAPNDLQLILYPAAADKEFAMALRIANEVIGGVIESVAAGATHYFDDSISAPAWATAEKFVRKIGRLNFYREP